LAIDPINYWLVRGKETKSDADRAWKSIDRGLPRPFVRDKQFLQNRDAKIGSPNDPEEISADSPEIQMFFIASATLGPKQKVVVPGLGGFGYRLTAESVSDAMNGKSGRFYYGIARYTDIFHVKHVTKYCYRMDGMIIWQNEPAKPVVSLCRHWNCTDDQCKEDRTRYDAEVAVFTEAENQKK
jgi:hypothetical protein